MSGHGHESGGHTESSHGHGGGGGSVIESLVEGGLNVAMEPVQEAMVDNLMKVPESLLEAGGLPVGGGGHGGGGHGGGGHGHH
jgi:hypothetical protein